VKITHLETFDVAPRWCLLKLHTDEGIVGISECLARSATKSVVAYVHDLATYLTGKEPLKIEHHWQAMYRGAFWRRGLVICAAISSIEIALWDILGKALGVPIYQLLGGKCRDRLRMYP